MTACVPVRFRLSGSWRCSPAGWRVAWSGRTTRHPTSPCRRTRPSPAGAPIGPASRARLVEAVRRPDPRQPGRPGDRRESRRGNGQGAHPRGAGDAAPDGGGPCPRVSGTASSTHSRTSASATGFNISSNSYQSGFAVSWEIDLFGETRRGIEAADRGIEVAEETCGPRCWSSSATWRRTMWRRAVSSRVPTLPAAARAPAADRGADARKNVRRGASSAVDVARATAIANSTAANVPTLETAFAASPSRIGVLLLGREPAAVVGILRRGGIPSPRRNLPPGIPADVLLNRPDVRAASGASPRPRRASAGPRRRSIRASA